MARGSGQDKQVVERREWVPNTELHRPPIILLAVSPVSSHMKTEPACTKPTKGAHAASTSLPSLPVRSEWVAREEGPQPWMGSSHQGTPILGQRQVTGQPEGKRRGGVDGQPAVDSGMHPL